jgi:hypothetical protein
MKKKTDRFKKLHRSFDSYHKKTLKQLDKSKKTALVNVKANATSLVGGAVLASGITTLGSTGIVPIKPQIVSLVGDEKSAKNDLKNEEDRKVIDEVKADLLSDPSTLSIEQEQKVEQALSNMYGLDLKVTLDGNRMNRVWGYFGQEQHLYRWPGDSLQAQGQYLEYGIAPATGAFGYFDNAEQEQYYIAAPIHLLPDWNTEWPTLKPWYRFRKVVVYNPKNNKAVVAVIGDAGPAKWTGKNFGGSPEVMRHLDMYDGSAKSRAVVLFVDESGGKVDLGPIDEKINAEFLANAD